MSASQQSPVGAQPSVNILNPFTPQQLAASAAASAALRSSGKKMLQQTYTTAASLTYGVPTTVNLPVQPIGLNTKFFVEVTAIIANPSGGSAMTRTPFGPFNICSQIQYTDPSTNQRINTTGWHVGMTQFRRHRRVPGAALTTDSPTGFGSNGPQPLAAPASIAANTTNQIVRMIYEIPLSIGQDSLKGAVFSGATFTTQSLQITLNPNLCQNGTDPLGAVYTGASNSVPPTFSGVTVTLFQEFWDQFSLGLLDPLTPDLSMVYELKNTALSPLVVNLDNFVRFTNLRTFLSTVLAFDNNGTMNPGTDVNYFLLQSANQTKLRYTDIYLQEYIARNQFADGTPAGVYIFDWGKNPIVTAAEGNTVLSINPSTVNSGAVLSVGWEDIAVAAVLASASSLPGIAGVG
jgi:hypothetical protein